MRIAVEQGYHTGSRSTERVYPIHQPLYLLDIRWERYDWPAHLALARCERPALAAVPDITDTAMLPAVLGMAEELAPHCEAILIIPKATVPIPASIAGTPVVLGYSVPTRYGSTDLGLWEFGGRPVHLLGGTPLRQITLARYLDVVSADGNMAQKMAHRGWYVNERGHGDSWRDHDDGVSAGMPARALRRSLENIWGLWERAGFTLERREDRR